MKDCSMKKIILYISLFLFLLACSTGTQKQIKEINASLDNVDNDYAVFRDFSLVRLETTDSCLLENIVKVDMQDDIYLLSSYGGKIHKFTKDGHFLWSLKQGNGPGELLFATDFYVDYRNKSLYVLDNYKELKIFSFDGKYVKSEPLSETAFLFTKKDNSFLLFDSNLKRKSDFNFYVSKDGVTVKEGLQKKENNRNVGYMPGNVFADYSDKDIYIQHMLSDTIYSYSLTDNKLKPAFYIYTNNLSVNAQDITFPDSHSFYQVCKEKNLLPGIAGLSFLNDKIYLIMYYDEHPFYVVYDCKEEKSVVSTLLCKGFPNSTRCIGRSKNGITYCYDAEELSQYCDQESPINKSLAKLMESVKMEDNPVLVSFR